MGYMSMPEDMSLLHSLFNTKANGGFSSIFAVGSVGAHDRAPHEFDDGRHVAVLGDDLTLRVFHNICSYDGVTPTGT